MPPPPPRDSIESKQIQIERMRLKLLMNIRAAAKS